MANLSAVVTNLEMRMNQCRSNKIEVQTRTGEVLATMDRPMGMSHDAFVKAYLELIEKIGDKEIATMSAFRTAKLGQSIDDAPCTMKIKVL